MAACALIHRDSLDAALPWLAGLHTPEQDEAFFSGPVFDACHGFTAERFTDGAGNEEREPDVLYRRPAVSAA